ncbi:UNKNOWN [Stylonychia lemnae]|uniref:Uncharacterized protein n=1 Tax=Stylonychia lemnae TaxID=5949 RepID=A0A078B9N5_STYLE|nr:UNKNOWN [Stylonychia lemnae]|eukprot:CDW91149.1 UNKNOWN [Stylonychia lemnae]
MDQIIDYFDSIIGDAGKLRDFLVQVNRLVSNKEHNRSSLSQSEPEYYQQFKQLEHLQSLMSEIKTNIQSRQDGMEKDFDKSYYQSEQISNHIQSSTNLQYDDEDRSDITTSRSSHDSFFNDRSNSKLLSTYGDEEWSLLAQSLKKTNSAQKLNFNEEIPPVEQIKPQSLELMLKLIEQNQKIIEQKKLMLLNQGVILKNNIEMSQPQSVQNQNKYVQQNQQPLSKPISTNVSVQVTGSTATFSKLSNFQQSPQMNMIPQNNYNDKVYKNDQPISFNQGYNNQQPMMHPAYQFRPPSQIQIQNQYQSQQLNAPTFNNQNRAFGQQQNQFQMHTHNQVHGQNVTVNVNINGVNVKPQSPIQK